MRRTPEWIDQDLGESFDLRFDLSVAPFQLTGGFQHDVYSVQTQSGVVVLKCFVDPPKALAAKLELKAESKGVAIAPIIRPKDQNDVLWVECNTSSDASYYVRAHHHVPGTTLSRQPVAPVHAERIGRQLALLHQAGAELFAEEYGSLRSEVLLPEVAGAKDVLKMFPPDVVAILGYYLDELEVAPGKIIVGHRDISGKNTIIQEATGEPSIIDFDDTGLTTREGEVVDAAFNLSGIHSEAGPQEAVVRAFVRGYSDASRERLTFDRDSFHMLVGMSEWWWLNECLRRVVGRVAGDTRREQAEIERLRVQIPRDIRSIGTFVTWLSP